MAGFDDCHAASVVTDLLDASASAAVAVNCAVAPTNGAVPVTVTPAMPVNEEEDEEELEDGADEVADEEGDAGELVHAAHRAATTATAARTAAARAPPATPLAMLMNVRPSIVDAGVRHRNGENRKSPSRRRF